MGIIQNDCSYKTSLARYSRFASSSKRFFLLCPSGHNVDMATNGVVSLLNYTRIRLLMYWLFAFFGICKLFAAPDPDLFDGSVVTAGANHSSIQDKAGTKTEAGGIDMESNANGESTVKTTAKEAADQASNKTAASQKMVRGSSTAETVQQSTGSGRSFEEFEIGVIDEANSKVDVKRSKKFDSQSVSSSRSSSQSASSDSDPQNSNRKPPEIDLGDQQSAGKNGEADYGSNVPSGL